MATIDALIARVVDEGTGGGAPVAERLVFLGVVERLGSDLQGGQINVFLSTKMQLHNKQFIFKL